MSRVGIDPALMTQLINGMRRAGGTIPEVGVHVERALTSLGLQLWGPTPLRDIGARMSAQVPGLQGRLDLILATPDGRLGRGGLLWADDADWLSQSPAAGAATAKALAQRLRDQAKTRSLDAATLADLEKHRNDPYFAIAFAQVMPPRELKALLARLYGAGLPPSARPEHQDLDAQNRLATALSTVLGTASRGAGRLKLPAEYADQLIEDIENPATAFAIGKLLRTGTFDAPFLLNVVTKVYDHDHAHPPDPQRRLDLWTIPGAKDALPPGDLTPMAAVLPALVNHPAVAQDFFTDPNRKPLAYLMRQRPWTGEADNTLGAVINAAATTYRDHDQPPGESRGYKSALVASWAAHFWSDEKVQANLPHTRIWAASLLAAYITDVHRTSEARSGRTLGVFAVEDPDVSLSGVEPYGAALDGALNKQIMKWAFGDEDAFKTMAAAHAQYSAKLLDEKAAEVAAEVKAQFDAWHHAHPDATGKENEARRQKILEGVMQGGGGAEFSGAVGSLSMTTYMLTHAAGISSIKAAKADDQRFALFKEMVTKVVDLAPGPSGKFAGLLVGQAKEQIYGKAVSDRESAARKEARTALAQARHMFRDLTAASMMRHGLFGDGSPPAVTHPHRSTNFPEGSPGDFLLNGEIISRDQMSEDQQTAYDEWMNKPETDRVFLTPDSSVDGGFNTAAILDGDEDQ
ncbi:hypothetical protein [Nonomuraea rhizosphaerae]|uniref:hypothetical protein n=1 Tax=Nonomuraea rhizosphaerae TaxID=2665663 RepID=UPI001C5DA104|nr:hypothetical protein [Nonomuraea rhizosphaerae]